MNRRVTKSRKKSGIKVTNAEAEKMFKYWANGPDGSTQTDSAVARKFNRSRMTIARVKKGKKWYERLNEITAKLIEKTNETVSKQIESTRGALSDIFKKSALALVAFEKLEIKNVEEFTRVMGPTITLGRLVSELEGAVSPEGGGITNIWNLINEGIPKTLTDKEITSKCEQYGSFNRRVNLKRF